MKKKSPIVIGILVVVVLVAIYLLRGGDAPVTVGEPGEGKEPRVKLEPVELSPVEFEMVEVPREMEEGEEEDPEAELAVTEETVVVPGIRVGPDQVLAVINGRPLTGKDLMPPGRFKQGRAKVVPKKDLEEVLERSIARELIFQEAEAQGVVLGERAQKQLDGMYEHLTGNPLNLPEGVEILDRNAWGDEEDAAWQVRSHASHLLQVEFLAQSGQSDTAEARLAFRQQLKDAADIEVVDLTPPEE